MNAYTMLQKNCVPFWSFNFRDRFQGGNFNSYDVMK